MLAQSFKSAVELGISDAEMSSLIAVMRMFERGEIKPEQFFMKSIESYCGTRACIMGWCQKVSGPDVFSADIDTNYPLFGGLFMFGDKRRFTENDPAHAAMAIRSYLTTGDARWDLAIA